MSASDAGYPVNGIHARVDRAERDIEKLDREKAEKDDMSRLADEVAGLRRALIGFAITIGGSAIVFAFGIVAALG
jgi:hypothetical protein